MGLLGQILFGLVVGIIAKLLMPGRDPGGWIITILLGVAGALLGGFVGRALWGGAGVTGFNLPSFVTAILGAVVLLVLYRAVAGRRTIPTP